MGLATSPNVVGKNSGGSTSTDLYQLWQNAFASYDSNLRGTSSKKAVSIENLPRIRTVDGVIATLDDIAAVDEASRKWSVHRHNKGRLDRLRSVVGEYLGLAQTVGDLVVQSAVASFPPAAAIWTVATYAIKTAQAQSADYDKLADLIVEAGGFLQVLHIIETKVPGSKQYQECVTEVFTSLLVVFAIQTRFMTGQRALTFFRDAVRGNDQELAAAYTKVRKAIDRLSQANGFRAVANTEDLIRLMGDLDLKLDMQHREIMTVFAQQGENFQGLFQLSWEQISLMRHVDKTLKEMMKGANTREQGSESQGIPSTLKSPIRRGAHLVNFYFANPTDPAIRYQEIETRFVTGTSKWLFEHDLFLSWKDGKLPLLWIVGEEGEGKTFLAYAIVKSMKEGLNDQPRASVAYHFFEKGHWQLSSLKNALCSIIIQIAAVDNRYCEKVAADLSSEQTRKEDADLQYIWRKYLAPNFGPESDMELYLVLDGLDVTYSADRSTFLDLLDQIQTKSLKIRVILTSHPATMDMKRMKTGVIEMTVEQTSHDIARIVEERCKSRRLTHHYKRKVIAKITESADCLLYVDRTLHDLKSLGGGRRLWQALDELPDGLDDLYTKLLTKSRARRSPMEWEEVKRLYAFVAFSFGPLTLKELVHLLSPLTQNKLIDVEQEISGDSASILELARYPREDDVTADPLEFRESGARMDDLDSVADDDGSAAVKFRERSLETFFQRYETDDDLIGCGLVASPLEANLDLLCASIKLMCVPHHEGDEHPMDGLDHAVNRWYRYLSDTASLATDSQALRVVNALKEISDNRAEVAKAIEEHGGPYYYADFAVEVLAAIAVWVKRAAGSVDARFSVGADEWVIKMNAEPEELLRHLAQGHVINWYQRVNWKLAGRSFEAARDALAQTKSSPITSETTDFEAIEVIAHYFDDLRPRGTGSQLAVALALVWRSQYSKALTYCHNILTNCVDVQEKFLSQVILADIYASMARDSTDQDSEEAKTNWKTARDYASAALALSPGEFSSINPEVVKEMRWKALAIRADCENRAGQYKEAVNTNEVARGIWPERSGLLVSRVATILSERKEHSELMKKVEIWGLENRLYWLALTAPMDFESFIHGPNIEFQKAAKLASLSEGSSGCTPVSTRGTVLSDSLASMVRIYQEMIEYLGRKNQSACLRYRLACAYREVVGDDLSSKDILDTLLNGDSCYDPCTRGESEFTLVGIRYDLATIIFEEFRASTGPQQKIALLNELEDIPNRRLGKGLGQLELFNFGTAIIQGKMIRKVRSAPEYQEHMEKAFQTCMAALSDSVAWNDQASLIFLAKILTCVEGLEMDAQIAISAQLSHVEASLALFGNEAVDFDEGELSPKSSQAANGNAGGHKQSTAAEAEDTSVAQAQKPDVKFRADDLKDSPKDALNDDPDSPGRPPGSQEEDITPLATLGCTGCGKQCRSWAEMGPYYTCLICPLCALCQECYDKRQALNRGDTSASWRSFCGKDHEYLKAPVAGWRGVKDGVMTIGEQPQKFKVWLEGLRDKRWGEAWAEFWKGA